MASKRRWRRWAERTDKKRMAEHEKAEKAYLTDFQRKLREALGWDYSTAQENGFEVSMGSRRNRPECPTSRVAKLDALLARLRLTSQEQFTLNEGETAHFLLTHDDDLTPEMC